MLNPSVTKLPAGTTINFDNNRAYQFLRKYIDDNLTMLVDKPEMLEKVSWLCGADPNLCLAMFDWDFLDELRTSLFGTAAEAEINMSFFGENLSFNKDSDTYTLGESLVGAISDKGTIRFIVGARVVEGEESKVFYDLMSLSHLSFGYKFKE